MRARQFEAVEAAARAHLALEEAREHMDSAETAMEAAKQDLIVKSGVRQGEAVTVEVAPGLDVIVRRMHNGGFDFIKAIRATREESA